MSNTYMDEISKSMHYLASFEDTLFIGQSVEVAGTAMRNTLLEIDSSKLLELPVEEDFQVGLSIGLALTGKVPVSIFPRWNFLLLATNQIVNHLDKLKELTQSPVPGKVILRTGIGSEHPLNPGPQHTGDFTEAFKIMCPNINVVRLDSKEDIFREYKKAYEREDGVSSLLVEWSDRYND
jgi:pyruvate/2-oxoglutarate/acetoin dehydrogenase E1 component